MTEGNPTAVAAPYLPPTDIVYRFHRAPVWPSMANRLVDEAAVGCGGS